MNTTIIVTEDRSNLLEDLEIYPCGDVQLEVNGWEADSLDMIEPGTYEVYDEEVDGQEATYEIWYCDEEGEAGWRYLYLVG